MNQYFLFNSAAENKVVIETERISQIYIFNLSEKILGKENALLICNHRSDIDWLIGWVMAQVLIISVFIKM